MGDRIRVLIVDDQQRARQSLRALLSTWPQAGETREAASGRDAVRLVEESQPDVVVMDVRMPGMDGVEATRLIKDRWPQVKVVLLSMYNDYRNTTLTAGADAFVSKGEPADKLFSVLSALAGG